MNDELRLYFPSFVIYPIVFIVKYDVFGYNKGTYVLSVFKVINLFLFPNHRLIKSLTRGIQFLSLASFND